MEKLRNLILFFINNYPRPIKRTELMKLVYLYEYEHVQIFGRQYSEVCFERYKNGPYATAVIKEANYLAYKDYIFHKKEYTYSLDTVHIYGTIKESAATSECLLSKWEEELGYAIIAKTKDLTFKEIMDLTYSTPPMVKILLEEKKTGKKLYRSVINMKEHKAPYKITKERLEAAQKRLDAVPDSGSDEEYYASLLETYKKYEDLRRRAQSCLLQN
jgi:hypothetical protein